MFTSLTPRSSQPLAASSSTRAQFRALLLGGLAVLGSAGAALAQEGPSLKIKQGDDAQSLLLTVENPTQQRMRMEVISLGQQAKLVDVANRDKSYGSKLLFNGLPAGQYVVQLKVGQGRYRYDVTVPAQPQTAITVKGLMPEQAPTVASATR